MKQCPVCKENFADEFSFCDLDGAQLDGDSKAAVAGGSSGVAGKLWPIVGVVLVLGAVATVIGSIIFFPRALSAPPPINQTQNAVSAKSGSGNSSSASTDSTQTANAVPPSDSIDDVRPGKGTEPVDPALAGLRQNGKKNAAQRDPNQTDGPLDPKSAVQPAADIQPVDTAADNTPRTIKTPATTPDSKPTARDGASTSGGDTSTTGAGGATTTTQVKHRTARTSTADGDDGTVSKNSKKKKGGFLKIFKKIFGQG